MGLVSRFARSFSIRGKLTWMNMLVCGAALLIASAAFVFYDLSTFRDSMVRSLSIQAQIAGSNSASAILFSDPDSAGTTLSALRAASNVTFAGVYTPSGEPFAVYWRERAGAPPLLPSVPAGRREISWFEDNGMDLVRSIVIGDKLAGWVYLRSDLSELNARLRRYGEIVSVVLLISLLAALVLSAIFQRAITQPIVALANTARIVSRDRNYSIRAAATENHDEIAVLIESFNEMLGQIQGRDAALEAARDELEQRVARRTAELQHANRELEAFTYSVAHDLRAPLRHMQGFSDILIEDFAPQLSAEARHYLEKIVEGTRRMGALIHDLLSLAQVGRQEMHMRVTSLDALVREVRGELSYEVAGRDIEWRLGSLPAYECDAGLMKQVFYNLLSNAVKYTRPRELAVIEVGQQMVNGQTALFVRDNGVGFSMDHANKLFGVFQRLHRREEFEGMGVGLAIVQRIIYKHGGRIWAEAEPDRGATFWFTLSTLKTGA
jgi:signal transduction histidine kinase